MVSVHPLSLSRWHTRHLLVRLTLGLLALLHGSPACADAPSLDAALKKVKAATVQLQVKLANDRLVQGSGFFTDEPGLIITDAHVLNMLDADSRRPARVNVVLTDAAGKQRTAAPR